MKTILLLLSAALAFAQTPLPGVQVKLSSGQAVTTDASGNYTLSLKPPYTGILAPTLPGWVFSPPSISYNALSVSAITNFLAFDVQAPAVSLSYPTDGETIPRNTLTLKCTATDNLLVVSVAWFLDGRLLGTKTAAPWSLSWSASNLKQGSQHSFSVLAVDSFGNVGWKSAQVTVQ